MLTESNALFTVVYVPASSKQELERSVLPERFVSSSEFQPTAIVGEEFGGAVRLVRPIGQVMIPVAAG